MIHAALIGRLIARPEFSDVFGLAGRRWLGELELPWEERENVDSCTRQIEFVEVELAELDRVIALDALERPEIKRLISVPGVNVVCATTFLAAIGHIERSKNPRKLVGYLGLDPKIHQSGPGPGTSGHISTQGSASARWALLEAAWSTVRQPGPLRATNDTMREAEHALAQQAKTAYQRTVRDRHATQANKTTPPETAKVGASATPRHASNRPKEDKAARQTTNP